MPRHYNTFEVFNLYRSDLIRINSINSNHSNKAPSINSDERSTWTFIWIWQSNALIYILYILYIYLEIELSDSYHKNRQMRIKTVKICAVVACYSIHLNNYVLPLGLRRQLLHLWAFFAILYTHNFYLLDFEVL